MLTFTEKVGLIIAGLVLVVCSCYYMGKLAERDRELLEMPNNTSVVWIDWEE